MPSYKDVLLGFIATLLAVYAVATIVANIGFPDIVYRGSLYRSPLVKCIYAYADGSKWSIVIVVENTYCCKDIVVTNILINGKEIDYYNATVEPKLPHTISYGEQTKVVVKVSRKEFSPGQFITVTIVLGGYSQQYVIRLH